MENRIVVYRYLIINNSNISSFFFYYSVIEKLFYIERQTENQSNRTRDWGGGRLEIYGAIKFDGNKSQMAYSSSTQIMSCVCSFRFRIY